MVVQDVVRWEPTNHRLVSFEPVLESVVGRRLGVWANSGSTGEVIPSLRHSSQAVSIFEEPRYLQGPARHSGGGRQRDKEDSYWDEN